MKTIRIWIVLALIINFYGNLSAQKQGLLQGNHLAETKLMTAAEIEGLRPQMLEGMRRYFEKELKFSPQNRETNWERDYSSISKYLESVSLNRSRFKRITGVVDKRIPLKALIFNETTLQKALVAETERFTVYSVSWPVLEGVTGAGLWVEPHTQAKAQLVIIPDADQSPEMLMGLSSGIIPESQFARRFADAGCRILIPVLINREDTWSGNPEVRMTNQPHREFIYRRAYELGRHIIGYEIQKVLAAVDWFTYQFPDIPVGVAGYGEGGLIAFYSAAIDTRIKGSLISGYFQEREGIWEEPIYRNIWGLLEEFGDAEIAGLIAPRFLIIEACKAQEIDGPPVPRANRSEVAAPGRIITPPLESVQAEAARAKIIYSKLDISENFQLVVSEGGNGLPGTSEATERLLKGIGFESGKINIPKGMLTDRRIDFAADLRMQYQIKELSYHMDMLVNRSSEERKRFWSNANPSSVDQWNETIKSYKKSFWNELIGKMPAPSKSFNPSTRLTYKTPHWNGYWIKLDIWPDIIAGGILLIPKNIKPGERRPVVVFQHGLGGLPEPLIDPNIESVYYSFGSKLADLGYVVYAPQNPYGLLIEEPRNDKSFRIIQRMANPLKKSLFSVIIGQHDQTLQWLKQLPFIDGGRIGFYGLSYGGKSAMRISPVLEDYSVVICSGDFNEWVWKLTSVDFSASNMFGQAYEIFEFNLANTFNYAELAGLIAPRPFMVERGHWDGVAPDEWVAYEYAKVRRLYISLGIGDRTTIEFFNGPHEIHGVGTLDFLNKHLKSSKDNF